MSLRTFPQGLIRRDCKHVPPPQVLRDAKNLPLALDPVRAPTWRSQSVAQQMAAQQQVKMPQQQMQAAYNSAVGDMARLDVAGGRKPPAGNFPLGLKRYRTCAAAALPLRCPAAALPCRCAALPQHSAIAAGAAGSDSGNGGGGGGGAHTASASSHAPSLTRARAVRRTALPSAATRSPVPARPPPSVRRWARTQPPGRQRRAGRRGAGGWPISRLRSAPADAPLARPRGAHAAAWASGRTARCLKYPFASSSGPVGTRGRARHYPLQVPLIHLWAAPRHPRIRKTVEC